MSRVAAGKAVRALMKAEHAGFLRVNTGSVYGAALVLPQIARSVGWPKTLTALSMRSYIFLLFNFVLQGFLVSLVAEAALLMAPYAGEMHLCDFGRDAALCPGAPNCQGPTGTTYSMKRLYGFSDWATRKFVKDAMLKVFPDKKD